jgi:hypothetical protein
MLLALNLVMLLALHLVMLLALHPAMLPRDASLACSNQEPPTTSNR